MRSLAVPALLRVRLVGGAEEPMTFYLSVFII